MSFTPTGHIVYSITSLLSHTEGSDSESENLVNEIPFGQRYSTPVSSLGYLSGYSGGWVVVGTLTR